MRIVKLHIDSFMGSFDRDIEFSQGVNILRGDNESGKSTVSEFIKFMLYGASARAQDGEMPERQKYLSFGESYFGGAMEIITEKGRFHIDRKISQAQSGAFRESLSITDLDKKVQVFKGENAGDALLSIPENIFKKVAYISQENEAYTGGSELGSAIENLLFSADETVSTDKALKKIDSLRVTLLHKNGKGGIIYECAKERNELESRLETAQNESSEIIAKEGSLIETENKIAENKSEYNRTKKICDMYDNYVAYTKFNALDEANAEYEKLSAEKKALDEAFGDFIPDGEYLGRLRHAAETVEAYDRSVTTAKNKFENAVAARAAAELALTDGGNTAPLEEAAKKLASIKASAKLFLTLGLIAIVFGIAFACTVFLMKLPPVLYAISGAFAVAGTVLIAVSSLKKKKISAMLIDHGVSSEGDLIDRTKEMTETGARSHNALARAREAEATAAALLENEEKRLAEVKEAFILDAKRIGKSGDEGNMLFEIVEKYISSQANLSSQIKLAFERKKQLEKETAPYDRETVQKLLDSIGDISVFEKLDITEFTRMRDFLENAISALEIKKGELEKSLAALHATAQNPALIKATLDSLRKKEEAAKAKHAATELAMRAIENASEGLRKRVSPHLAEFAGKLMGVMTDGKYTDIGVDSEMNMTFLTEGNAHEISYLSKGTREIAYFALRIALCDLLCKEEKLPLILDECFAHTDDKRTKQMIKILMALSKENTQSIILTCHLREEKIADEIGVANLITL